MSPTGAEGWPGQLGVGWRQGRPRKGREHPPTVPARDDAGIGTESRGEGPDEFGAVPVHLPDRVLRQPKEDATFVSRHLGACNRLLSLCPSSTSNKSSYP